MSGAGLRRIAAGRGAVAAAFALHILTLATFVWRARGESERLYWEYGGRLLGRAWTAGYPEWVQHRTGDFPDLALAQPHPYAAPYSEFPAEYPPGALWLFAAIRGVAERIGAFSDLLHGVMALACVGTAALAWRVARRRGEAWIALPLIAVWPLLVGPLAVVRFDAVAALLAASALLLAARGQATAAGAAAGLGAAVKIWPGLLVPFLCALLWRSGGRGRAIGAAAGAALGVGLPHLALLSLGTAPGDLLGYLGFLRDRPPEVESLVANLLALASRLGGWDIAAAFDFGSFNLLSDAAPGWLAAASLANAALLLGLLALTWFGRRDGDVPGRLAAIGGAAVCATIACSRVFSSEYLIWLLPFAILAAGRRGGLVAVLCYAGALLSLKLFYRFPEWPMGLSGRVIALSLAKNLLVVATGIAFAVPLLPLNSRGQGAMFGRRQDRTRPSP